MVDREVVSYGCLQFTGYLLLHWKTMTIFPEDMNTKGNMKPNIP